MHFFRGNEAEAGVLEFKPVTAGRNQQAGRNRRVFYRAVIHQQCFNHDRRGKLVGDDVLRIHNPQAFAGGKPQSPVRSPAPGRLKPARTFQRRETIADAVSQAMHFLDLSVGATVQFRFFGPDDAVVRTHPKITIPIVLNIADDTIRQSLVLANDRKMPIPQAAEAATEGADPERAFVVKVQALDIVAGQAIASPKPFQHAILPAAQPATGHAEPNGAVLVFDHGPHVAQGFAPIVQNPRGFAGLVAQ